MTLNKLYTNLEEVTKKNRLILNIIGKISFLLSALYVVFLLFQYKKSISFIHDINHYIGVLLLIFMATSGLGLIWYYCLKVWKIGNHIKFLNIFLDFHLTSFLKYLPTGILGFGTRHYRLVKLGAKSKPLLRGLITEFTVALTSAMSLCFVWFCFIILPIKIALLSSLIFFLILNLSIVIFFKKLLNLDTLKLFYISFSLFLIYHFTIAVCFWNLSSLDVGHLGYAVVIYLTGWILGFLVPFVPGGLAIREGVILHLAIYTELEEYFLSSLILTRMIIMASECFLALLAYVMVLQRRNDI